VDDGALIRQDWPRFRGVLEPKVAGALNLEQLTRQETLDFFVLFSSVATVLGWRGQGSYAAANAYLDAFAARRRSAGLPGLSINWGNWGAVGMTGALDAAESRRMAEHGILPMDPDAALTAFGQVPLGGPAQLVVAALGPAAPGVRQRPFLQELAPRADPARVADAPAVVVPGEPALLERWAAAPGARRRDLLVAHVREEIIRALALPADLQITPRQPFHDLGLDSLMAIELRNALSQTLASDLPATLLFDRPTTETLVDYLLEHVPALAAAAAAEAAAAPAQPSAGDAAREAAVAELAQLSDAEAEALLLAELNSGAELK
jgi:polyketide synthase 12/myxalamid-type polyketide synthase MxaB